ADFNSELDFSFSSTDPDDDFGSDSETFDLKYTHYLGTVSTNNKPYDEAAFLDRVSSFSVGGGLIQSDFAGLDADGFAGSFNYTHRNPKSPFVFSINTISTGIDGDEQIFTSSIDFEQDTSNIDITIGYYTSPTMLIRGGYSIQSMEQSANQLDPGFFEARFSLELDITTISAGIKAISQMSQGQAHSFEFDFGVIDIEADIREFEDDGVNVIDDRASFDGDGNAISLAYKYYMDNRTSIGFNLVNTSADVEGEDGDSTIFGFAFRTFSTDSLGIGFSLDKVNSDDGLDEEATIIRINVISRFN
ncbi:MAG: hypothetical protein PVG89_12265, partial [Gammaproteobacteria bacterium]